VKINDINPIKGINKYQQTHQQERELKKSEKKKDQISISEEAKAMLEETKHTSKQERIAELKEQIDSGTYQVDSKLVADKMLKWYKGK